MALILKYRLEPPEALNQEVYDFLAKSVGEVGLNVQIPLGLNGEGGMLQLTGQFTSVEGEHFEQRAEGEGVSPIERPDPGPPSGPVLVDDGPDQGPGGQAS